MYMKKRRFFKVLQTDLEQIVIHLQGASVEERATRNLRNLARTSFSRNQALFTLWKKYEQHLVVLDDIDDTRHYSGSDPESFFNLDSILTVSQHSFVSVPIWTAIPQALTSIGIIGTFSSIFMVLFFNKGAIDQTFIQSLVEAVATGFLSSIVGVSLAVWFLMFEKIKSHKIDNKTDSVNQCLTDFFPLLNTDALLHEQVKCLKNLSRDINVELTCKFVMRESELVFCVPPPIHNGGGQGFAGQWRAGIVPSRR
jgi:hypothetical protein